MRHWKVLKVTFNTLQSLLSLRMRTMTSTRRLSEDSNCKTRRRKLNQEAARHPLTLQRCCWHGVPRETTPWCPFLISNMSSSAERTSASRGTGSWRRGGCYRSHRESSSSRGYHMVREDGFSLSSAMVYHRKKLAVLTV